jgi:YbbR domain-containing protein
MIRIKGPKNRVQMITALSTIPVDLTSLKETTVIPLSFDFKAMGIDPDSVLPEMNVEIQGRGPAFKVKHVPLKVKSTGKATLDDEEVTVIVRTDPGDSVKVDGDEIIAIVDVRDMPSGEYEKLIRVQLPEKVHLVKVIPSSTRVVVKGQ